VAYSYRMSVEYKGRQFDNAGAGAMALEKLGGAGLIVREHASAKRRPQLTPRSRKRNNKQGM
jgi:hypothetical protein